MDEQAGLLAERMTRQGFADRPAADPGAAAALGVAIQAQDPPASRLGIRVRAAAVTEADVVAAVERGSVARTWLMRATIHLVDTADLRWLVRLIGPSIIRRHRTRWGQLGLDDTVLERSLDVLPDVLADGPLARRDIAPALAERGMRIDVDDPAPHTHLLLHASALGLVCRGADRGRVATFALLDAWVPDAPDGPSGDDALAELARRYFRAFSPATTDDFTAWSGLAGGRAVTLIRDELSPVDVDGRAGWRLGTVEPARGLRLLPAFDNYLIGYRHRDALLSAELRPRVYAGGMIYPTVLLDGALIGRWKLVRPRRDTGPLQVEVEPFDSLPRTTRAAIDAEIADLARFYDRPAEWTTVD